MLEPKCSNARTTHSEFVSVKLFHCLLIGSGPPCQTLAAWGYYYFICLERERLSPRCGHLFALSALVSFWACQFYQFKYVFWNIPLVWQLKLAGDKMQYCKQNWAKNKQADQNGVDIYTWNSEKMGSMCSCHFV